MESKPMPTEEKSNKSTSTSTSTNKKSRGQFYTTHSAYILDGFPAPPSDVMRIVEPFAGKGDLMDWIKINSSNSSNSANETILAGKSKGKSKSNSATSTVVLGPVIEAYDIEPKRAGIQKRDTLANPPDYSDAWIITNPPYLARNKSAKDNKDVYDLYEMNDLYKCFIMSVVNQRQTCRGGIFIIPAGFFFSPRAMDARCRGEFMSKYRITKVRYFEEAVFDDTATTIVAFSFERLSALSAEQNVEWELMPSGVRKTFSMSAANDWIIGGDIYNLDLDLGPGGADTAAPVASVRRHVEGQALRTNEEQTNITLNALDSGTAGGSRICLTYKKDHVYPAKESSRTYATFRVSGLAAPLDEAEQMQLCDEFNELLEKKRAETWSLFLPQFRESKEYARKRIPFELAYRIFMHLLVHRILVQRR